MVASLILSHHTFTFPSSSTMLFVCPVVHHLFCSEGKVGSETLIERYLEQRVMNRPAVCNTRRSVGSSLVSDPNLMRQDSFSLSPPTHTHTHLVLPPLPAIAGVVHHPSIFSCLSLSYNPWKLPWSIKDWVVVLEGKHTPLLPTFSSLHTPTNAQVTTSKHVCVCVWATNLSQVFRHYWSEYSSH